MGFKKEDYPDDINIKFWVPKYDSPYHFNFRKYDNTTTVNYQIAVLILVGHIVLLFSQLVCIVFSSLWARLYSPEYEVKRPWNPATDRLPKAVGMVRMRYEQEKKAPKRM